MQQFIKDVQEALDKFKDHVHFPDAEVGENAYRTLLEAYRTALVPIWNLAQFADIEMVLKTIADKQMTELTVMSKRLIHPTEHQPGSQRSKKSSGPGDVNKGIERQTSIRITTQYGDLCQDRRCA